MSAQSVSYDDSHPPHGHLSKDTASTQASDKSSTNSHPPSSNPDPTTSQHHSSFHLPTGQDATQGAVTASTSSSSAELARLEVKLHSSLRQFEDFPTPGVLFEDIMPLFSSHQLHADLIRALELKVADVFHTSIGETSDIDVIVGLESRGFLFGPTLAMRLGAGFVPVRKKGKLPGSCETESFEKEYGADHFQIQSDAIQNGQKVVIVDDIIATGGSAAAAGRLVRKLGGELLGYVFMMELDFLKGREKLDAPVHTLFSGQDKGLEKET